MKKQLLLIPLILFIFASCHRSDLMDQKPEKLMESSSRNLTPQLSGELPCATVTEAPNKDYERMVGNIRLKSSQNFTCVRINFHIVRTSTGTGGFNANNIPVIMQRLNDAYNLHGIYFYNQGISYVNNTTYYDLEVGQNSEIPALISASNSSNALNFYLVNSVAVDQIGYAAGVAQDIPSRNLFVDNDYALLPTSEHEVGHCLNLFHTHRGGPCEPGSCAEATDGSNCSSCGDYVCDTPADPCLSSSNVDFNCTYTGGNGYNPQVRNFMSYAGSCRNLFSDGQGSRMRAALMNDPALQQVIITGCSIPTISGSSSLCNQTPFTLSNVPSGVSVVWSAEPLGRVTLSNPTSSGVTVEQIAGQYGNVTLRARLVAQDGSSISVFHNILLPVADVPYVSLNPAPMQCFAMGSTKYVYAGYSTTGPYQPINNHPNVSEVEWKILDYSTSTPTLITNFQQYNTSVVHSYISLNLPSKPSDYVITIIARAKHTCGQWGEWGPGHTYFVRRNCSSSVIAFDVAQEKSSGKYRLSFSESYTQVQKVLSANLNQPSKSNKSYKLTIFDNQGGKVYEKDGLNESSIIIPNLSAGNYTIEVLQHGHVFRQELKTK